ncbi:alkaline phosphatase [Flavobacterium magnum]|uniref:Alkaline phosphatase n=1 Tax=Flavobacterium magnum TaxID=2162713 RepID=A0A2S0RAZ8_9FLAO|nr:VTT domain-containing protein [Flavobacterium magnum]AWA28816.1 alkaline phosphatase [Flavobacterium magnum]
MTDFHWKNLLNPEYYINLEIGGVHVGLWVVLFIIFAETGLFAGFFLPGDSLLFLAGIYATGYYQDGVYVPGLVDQMFHLDSAFLNVMALSTFVAIAGILGNIVGYWFGSKSGTYLYNRQDSFWFKKKYLIQSRDFFEKHGGRAIIFSRFLPIFRTFAPIVAGIVAMDKKKFMFYNVVSSFLWSFTLIFAGNYLYKYLKESYQIDLKDHIELIIIGLVGITIIPVIYKFGKKTVTHSEE